MDPSETEVQEVQEEIHDVEEIPEAPESIVMKRKGRPAGAKNKVKGDTGGTPETTQDPMYTTLMKRLDSLDEAFKTKKAEMAKRQVKREKQPRKTAFKEPVNQFAMVAYIVFGCQLVINNARRHGVATALT